MNSTQVQYILKRTCHEVVLHIIYFFDLVLPDFTVFSVLRRFLWQIGAKIGSGTRIRKGQYCTHLRKLQIGSGCFVNRNNVFDNSALITIGNNCSIGYHNLFVTSSHYEKGGEREVSEFTTFSKPITIGDNVWITSNCTILPGVTVGDNCIIGAGSVVTKDCEKGGFYAGAPAKRIRDTEGFIAKVM